MFVLEELNDLWSHCFIKRLDRDLFQLHRHRELHCEDKLVVAVCLDIGGYVLGEQGVLDWV